MMVFLIICLDGVAQRLLIPFQCVLTQSSILALFRKTSMYLLSNQSWRTVKKHDLDVDNLRPISISNCLSQIYEKIIVITNPNLKNVSPNQFGFRKQLSTVHPLFILKEASLWCKNDNSPCYIASIVAAKAFDSVWRDGLFLMKIEI